MEFAVPFIPLRQYGEPEKFPVGLIPVTVAFANGVQVNDIDAVFTAMSELVLCTSVMSDVMDALKDDEIDEECETEIVREAELETLRLAGRLVVDATGRHAALTLLIMLSPFGMKGCAQEPRKQVSTAEG